MLLCFLWLKFPELFKLGYIYIALTPKYSAIIGKKRLYFDDDKALFEFKCEKLKNDIQIKTKGINIMDIVSISEDYKTVFNNIKNEFSLNEELLKVFINYISTRDGFDEEFINDFCNETGLKYSKKADKFLGMYNNQYHNFNANELIDSLLETLFKICNISKIKASVKGEIKIYNLIDLISIMDKLCNFELNYFKGLGI